MNTELTVKRAGGNQKTRLAGRLGQRTTRTTYNSKILVLGGRDVTNEPTNVLQYTHKY